MHATCLSNLEHYNHILNKIKTNKSYSKRLTTDCSPIGKVWEDTSYWQKRKKNREAKDQRPTTHPRTKPKRRTKRASPMPALDVEKALDHQSSPSTWME